MPLQKNEIYALTIDALSSDGNGIARVDGMAVFVPFSAIGDVLRVKIVKVCSSYAFGIIDTMITPSQDRTAPVCAIYGKCGGCCFGHISYEAELAAKQKFVADAMQRLGDIAAPVNTILPSPQPLRYRNKVQYPVTVENGTVSSGFYAGRSHRVVPCSDCALQPMVLNLIAQTACALLAQYQISIYDEAAHKGLVRHIYLRHAVTTDKVMVCFVINGSALPHAKDICSALCAAHPEIDTVVLNINLNRTNVITGEKCIPLVGDGMLNDTLAGVPVALSPLSFYQVNTKGAEQLYRIAAQFAALQPDDILLDLYCGTGTIGLSMLNIQPCKKLIGVEIIPQAIESARRNAAEMGVTNAAFFCGDAGEAAQKLSSEGLHPDVVVLDPPRKGCDEASLRAVTAMHPSRIVMVSCNPATAARDIQALEKGGYIAKEIQPVDMFPRTKHVECVVLLIKNRNDSYTQENNQKQQVKKAGN
ncbi:MAG: 23S rRNA (uracil(1939)-C(5))-methyltransferase RlmD [Ruthenibacterium sp.]